MPDPVALTVGGLFSGIGGFSLAAEWMGWRPIWECEIDPYASAVLAARFPGVPNLGDITKVEWSAVETPDVLCGGFPCQPHSTAGRRLAGEDERDLWDECVRAVRGLRPDYAVFENVPGLLTSDAGRFLNRVLRDLAEVGYDAEWQMLSAASVGAPHLRERIWIVAYPNEPRPQGGIFRREPGDKAEMAFAGCGEEVSDAHRPRRGGGAGFSTRNVGHDRQAIPRSATMADAASAGCTGSGPCGKRGCSPAHREGEADNALSVCVRDFWRAEPDVGRVAHGVPARVDRLRGLGNAIVPQCAVEGPFRRIREREAMNNRLIQPSLAVDGAK